MYITNPERALDFSLYQFLRLPWFVEVFFSFLWPTPVAAGKYIQFILMAVDFPTFSTKKISSLKMSEIHDPFLGPPRNIGLAKPALSSNPAP